MSVYEFLDAPTPPLPVFAVTKNFHDFDLTRVKVAKTGVKETTKRPSKYACPTNKNIEFWDLPGIGVSLKVD